MLSRPVPRPSSFASAVRCTPTATTAAVATTTATRSTGFPIAYLSPLSPSPCWSHSSFQSRPQCLPWALALSSNGGAPMVRTFSMSRSLRKAPRPDNFEQVDLPPGPVLEPPQYRYNPHTRHSSLVVPMGPMRDPVTVSTTWLREACNCDQCVDPHSGQRTYDHMSLGSPPVVDQVERTKQSGLVVWWKHDGFTLRNKAHSGSVHRSEYSYQFLVDSAGPGVPQVAKYAHWPTPWAAKNEQGTLFAPHTITYDDWMTGNDPSAPEDVRELYQQAIVSLDKTGILIVQGCPAAEFDDSASVDLERDLSGPKKTVVESVASRLGCLYECFYGRTWDVRSKPRAENVAYTNDDLGLHQDLLYMNNTPRIQLLHCIDNSCEGGGSIFSDGYMAALQIPYLKYRLLMEHALRYTYDKNGNIYTQDRPVFSSVLGVHHSKEVLGKPRWDDSPQKYRFQMAWSPHFLAPTQKTLSNDLGRGLYNGWFEAARQLKHVIEHPNHVLEHHLKPGECVLFDNWRVLHGRKKFHTDTGSRWLKGAYVDDQVYQSRVMSVLRDRETAGKWQLEARAVLAKYQFQLKLPGTPAYTPAEETGEDSRPAWVPAGEGVLLEPEVHDEEIRVMNSGPRDRDDRKFRSRHLNVGLKR